MSVDTAWQRGLAAPGGGQTRRGGLARARGRPRRPQRHHPAPDLGRDDGAPSGRADRAVGRAGDTPWRATSAASLPPAPTAPPPQPRAPVSPLAVGLVAPLITQSPTLSPHRSSRCRSGPAHRHDSDNVGASLRCALFCLSRGVCVCTAVSRVDAPPDHSQPSSPRSSQRARRLRYAFLVGRGRRRDGRQWQKKPPTPPSPSLPKN